ncbi:MAG: [FeFe] hydrogenase H-cluster radical SAM maturase HydE [Eubacteriales bacterium]|nr:[FeFe] hydrogenase H-cluster radical SAM maturase HydE [Eubacteriales bacterium]
MNKQVFELIGRLAGERRLEKEQYRFLIDHRTPEAAARLAELAVQARKEVYGSAVYVRGLIEISNICKNDCLYCGIRRGNRNCERYRLSREDILACCREGAALGFRTFVLQGGEDPFFCDEMLAELVRDIKAEHPGCAVTLSLGERSKESYALLKDAGADRYLLRHETANAAHYAALHPAEMSFKNRMRCLRDLKELGYQVGCGFMVGSPFQTSGELAEDLAFIEHFQPDMCGIGPFIPQHDTPFGAKEPGTLELTCYLLSILRLIRPNLLLPSTTALGTIHPYGREMGIQAGANVVMPNLSPPSARKKYTLYDNKAIDGAEAAQHLAELSQRMAAIGYEVVTDRGDVRPEPKK